MNAAKRRVEIMHALSTAHDAVSATKLANDLGVSRQIIVGDIALLRASGEKITSTPRGYVLSHDTGRVYTIACVHGVEDTEKELNIMVDNGCTVLTVAVEHPVYGLLTGELRISNRYDVQQFIAKMRSGEARPLSELTGGVHLHTLSCPDSECFERTKAQLEEQQLLYL